MSMERTIWVILFFAVVAIVVIHLLLRGPRFQYMGSNYYGGGNMEEQLAFIGGYKTYMNNQY